MKKNCYQKIIMLVLIFAITRCIGKTENVQAGSYGLNNPTTVQAGDDYFKQGYPIWDCIQFGSITYHGIKMPINWRVLSVEGNDAFIYTNATNLFQAAAYYENGGSQKITWEESSIRTWLNNDFLNTVFSQSEQKAIKTSFVYNDYNKESLYYCGNNTYDKIYLPSVDELTNPKYGFSSSKDASSTRSIEGAVGKYFWLRDSHIHYSPDGSFKRPMAATMLRDGEISTFGEDIAGYCDVHPVLHLDISNRNVWKAAGCLVAMENGCEYDSRQIQEINNKSLFHGWKNEKEGAYYYEEGRKVTGWKVINGKNYYFTSSGVMATGWNILNGKIFYFKKSGGVGEKGRMLSGWQTLNKKKFYFKKSGTPGSKGRMLTGWQTLNGNRYYLKKSGRTGEKGRMLTGWQTLGNVKYYFSSDGRLIEAATKESVAYLTYMEKQKMYGKYYAILNVGKNKTPVLIVADGNVFDGKTVTSSTYTPQMSGYAIHIYYYVDGKGVGVSGQVTQRVSSGPWYVYNNKLASYVARGGYRTLEIEKTGYRSIFSAGIPSDMEKKRKDIKLKKFTY